MCERFWTLPDTMAHLRAAGIALVPLGGDAGKKPIVKGWADKTLPFAQLLAIMTGSASRVYGVRTDSLAVIDCDHNDPMLIAQIEARFGPSSVHVKTPRGVHLYYLELSGKAPNLRAEGLPVDIKTGSRSYVVGPMSERPDGGQYRPIKGVLGETKLTAPLHQSQPKAPNKGVTNLGNGHRHFGLIEQAIQIVKYVDSRDDLYANLVALRDDLCEQPETFPLTELSAIASWAWTKRLEAKIYTGRCMSIGIEH